MKKNIHGTTTWTAVGEKATDIGISSKGVVWIISETKENYCITKCTTPTVQYKGYAVKKLVGGAFVEIHSPINPMRITVDTKGNAWIVDIFGVIFSYTVDGWIV